MDFILRKFENQLELNDPDTYKYITYSRARIEYCLSLCLGFLWTNLDKLDQEARNKILGNLNNLTLGSVVDAIGKLDKLNKGKVKLVNKYCTESLDIYPAIRNAKIGHGFDMADSINAALKPIYDNFVKNIPILKEECDIIIVKNYNAQSNTYSGIRLPSDKNGEGIRWSCPGQLFETPEKEFPRTYLSYKNKYYKITPFVFVDEEDLTPFIFSSLVEKINGKTKLCRLFTSKSGNDSEIFFTFNELICISKSDGYRKISQSNGTIMNSFELNHTKYVDVGIKTLVKDFLKKKANVTTTIWGHGGIGKTACAQSMCHDLFNEVKKKFSYIVFITAKDRDYNVRTGEITPRITGNIRRYSEVIRIIARTVFDYSETLSDDPETLSDDPEALPDDPETLRDDSERLKEYEKKIIEFKDTLLIVIDDYETFEDGEKEKIVKFLNSLNISYHKAIITTRNKRFVIGEEIASNELDSTDTKRFIEEVVSTDYKEHKSSIEELLSDTVVLEKIHQATSGRPIFIYQFIHIYVQKGYREDLIQGISTSEIAQKFLYGRIVKYLSQNALYVFAAISVLIDDNSNFNLGILEYVLNTTIPDKSQFEEALDEILDQKIIERIDDVYGRVYSVELSKIMSEQYQKLSHDFQNTVNTRLEQIGGRDIKGDVYDAIIKNIDNSRYKVGNEKDTVKEYHQVVINKNCPDEKRKIALKHMVTYLNNDKNDPMAAIAAIEEHLYLFSDDADIHYLYVYLLWSQNKVEKEKAVNVVIDFFTKQIHKKTSPDYIKFFALGSSYIIIFDLFQREYPGDVEDKARKQQLLKSFNEYGRFIYDYFTNNKYNIKEDKSLMHNIREALIQTVRLCYKLYELDANREKMAEYGMKIIAWLRELELKGDLAREINTMERGFILIGNNTESEQYHSGDVIKVRIIEIKEKSVIARISNTKTGLIFKSEITERWVENTLDEFHVGEICQAKIIRIDNNGKILLSTKGLRD